MDTDVTEQLQLSRAEYERFRRFIQDQLGLDFGEDKRHLLSRGLADVMAATGCANIDQLYDTLCNRAPDSVFWDRLVSALTVGETYFFRNASHWDALRQHILPELIDRRQNQGRRLRIWSAGCATGEEPYSMAILLLELLPNIKNWDILLLATDINRQALERARLGRYSSWSFRGVDARLRDACFHTVDDKTYAIDDRVRQLVTFDYLNLVADPYPSLANNTAGLDIILCRNVTIYFTADITRQVIDRFHNALVDGGWLIPGPSEPNMLYYGDFATRNFPGTVIYRKQPGANMLPTVEPAVRPAIPPRPIEPLPPTDAAAPITAAASPSAAPASVDTYEHAMALLEAGQLQAAADELQRILQEAPRHAPACYALGKIYANLGQLAEAREWCQRALEIDRLQVEPYYTLSLIYQALQQTDQAIDALKRAIYLNREFVLAHYNLAHLYQQQGDTLNAARSLHNARRLLETQPRDSAVPEGDGLLAGRLHALVEHELSRGA